MCGVLIVGRCEWCESQRAPLIQGKPRAGSTIKGKRCLKQRVIGSTSAFLIAYLSQQHSKRSTQLKAIFSSDLQENVTRTAAELQRLQEQNMAPTAKKTSMTLLFVEEDTSHSWGKSKTLSKKARSHVRTEVMKKIKESRKEKVQFEMFVPFQTAKSRVQGEGLRGMVLRVQLQKQNMYMQQFVQKFSSNHVV